MSDLLAAALSYAARNWHIIPLHNMKKGKCSCRRQCKSPGKHPRITKWQHKATTDPSLIREWWKKWPTANIGIVCGHKSGIVVIDIDPRNSGDKSLQNLIDSYPEFKAALNTYTIHTGGNGQHYFYKHNGPFKSVKKHGLGQGIDVQADGCYIVAPPSNHKSGGVYKVENNVELLELPQILIDLIKPSQPTVEHEQILEGNRNNHLSELAGEKLRSGKKTKQVETFILEQNTLRCVPPLGFGEVRAIVQSLSSRFNPTQKSLKTQWQELIVESKLSHGCTRACIGLSLWMDSDGRSCFPTEEQLEGRIHMTRKTIRKHLKEAQTKGFLIIYDREEKRRGRKNHGYIAQIPENEFG